MSMRNQVCPCIGPLTPVVELIDSDNFVGFGSAGSFIFNLCTDEVDWLERKDECSELELEVVPYNEAQSHLDSKKNVPGFPGRR